VMAAMASWALLLHSASAAAFFAADGRSLLVGSLSIHQRHGCSQTSHVSSSFDGRLTNPTMCAEEGQPPLASPTPRPSVATYAEAEERGFELYKAGEFERAVRMFELAQTLPGAGVDYTREKQSGMVGSANAPPNPRGLQRKAFATPAQRLIAQYNIACCYAGMGDVPRCVETLRTYLSQVKEPLDQVNEMIVDPDLAPARDDLLRIRTELKSEASTQSKGKGLFGLPFGNPLKDVADQIGVEWKD